MIMKSRKKETNGVLTQCKACNEWCESEFCSKECREYWDFRNEGRL